MWEEGGWLRGQNNEFPHKIQFMLHSGGCFVLKMAFFKAFIIKQAV